MYLYRVFEKSKNDRFYVHVLKMFGGLNDMLTLTCQSLFASTTIRAIGNSTLCRIKRHKKVKKKVKNIYKKVNEITKRSKKLQNGENIHRGKYSLCK